ncbi:hypothetical protein FRZ06_17655 [Anoxybacterium hadale]|uniref:Uncharacterized protein n=1 Tax=Anoxybacterium hadale TaxID=3408580 RepID=A0ACD1AFQ3_9FIRM|nr:hypothetical protein FRZ06_17655 [Clostridiales bacterium]
MRKSKILPCILAVALIAASLGACAKDEGGEVSVLKKQKETMAKVVSLDGDQITLILADTPEKNGASSDEVSSAATAAVRTSLLAADDSTAAQATPPEGQPPQGGGPGGGGGGRGGTPPEDGATPPEGGGAPPEGGQPPTSGAAVNGGQSDSGTPSGQPAQPERFSQPGQQDQATDQSGGENRQEPGQGGGEIQFTGGEVTFSLSSDLKVTMGNNKEETEIDLSEIKEGSVIMFTTVTDEDGNEVIDTIRILE